jgi:hypothetical protein
MAQGLSSALQLSLLYPGHLGDIAVSEEKWRANGLPP